MSMQQPCLPVAHKKRKKGNREDRSSSPQQPTAVDISFTDVTSMDASDYLAAVVDQASALPEYFVADNNGPQQPPTPKRKRSSSQQKQPLKDNRKKKRHLSQANNNNEPAIDGSAASLSYLMSHRTNLLPPPSTHHVPKNPSWVDETLADFSELRSYLERCRLQGIGGKKTPQQRMPLPPMKDRSGWHVFCVGQAEAEGNAGSYFDDSEPEEKEDDESEKDNVNETDEFLVEKVSNTTGNTMTTTTPIIPTPLSWRDNLPVNGYEPSVQLVLQMDQVLVRQVLSHLAFYVEEGWSPFTPQRAAWLYALLARLERPIHRDDAAILYSLLKVLTQVRSKMELYPKNKNGFDDRAGLARLNLLIIIIGIYLEQGDSNILL